MLACYKSKSCHLSESTLPQVSTGMSLQVMGNVEPGSKVVLWNDSRQPLQTWTTPMSGRIVSLTFPGMVLDVKGNPLRRLL